MFYLSNRPLFLWVYGAINHAGCWENTRKACLSVLPTSQLVYCASKPIERVVYCFYEMTMEDVCQRQGNVLYFRDQVAYSHQNHEIDAANQSQGLAE